MFWKFFKCLQLLQLFNFANLKSLQTNDTSSQDQLAQRESNGFKNCYIIRPVLNSADRVFHAQQNKLAKCAILMLQNYFPKQNAIQWGAAVEVISHSLLAKGNVAWINLTYDIIKWRHINLLHNPTTQFYNYTSKLWHPSTRAQPYRGKQANRKSGGKQLA